MPEIKLYQLEQQIQRPDNFWKAKCYLFTGKENFLKEELIDKCQKNAKIPRDGIEHIDAESKEARQEIISTLNTVGFDDFRKVVIIRNAEYIDASICKYLYESWDSSGIPDTVLPIFLAEDVDKRRRFWQLVREEGVSCQFWPMFEDQLLKWTMQRLQMTGLKFERGCDTLLVSLCGNNLRKISKEIEKIALLGEAITQKNIQAMVKKTDDAKKYDIEELFCQRQIAKLFTLLQDLGDNIEPKDIAMAIGRCVRHALQAKSYLEQKKEYAEQLLNAGKQILALQHRKDWPGISKRNEIIKAAGVVINGVASQEKNQWTSAIKLEAMDDSEEKVVTKESLAQDAEVETGKKKGKGKRNIEINLDAEKEKEALAEQKKRAKDSSTEAYNHNIWANKSAGNITRAFLTADKYSTQELLATLVQMSKIYFSQFVGDGHLIRANIDATLIELMTP